MGTRVPAMATLSSLALALTVGCRTDERTSVMIEVDSAGVRIVTSDPLGSDAMCALGVEPAFLVGADEDDDALWFTEVAGVARLSDGSVAVADRGTGQVRIFDSDARHSRTMGGRGEGPGEFRTLWGISVLADDTLWATDMSSSRHSIFSAEGSWIRAVRFNPVYNQLQSWAAGVLASGASLNVRRSFGRFHDFRVPDTAYVEAYGTDGSLLDTVATLVGVQYTLVNPTSVQGQLFDPSPSVDARGTTVAIANGRDPEVRILGDDFRLRGIVRWEDPDRTVTRMHVRASRDEYIARRGVGPGDEGWTDYDEFSTSDRRPAADVFPAVSGVQVGVDGTVWVFRYRRPGALEQPRPMGFGPNGDFVCHLNTEKDDYTIREFGADYVLGVHEDELGIHRVAMYDLERPAAIP